MGVRSTWCSLPGAHSRCVHSMESKLDAQPDAFAAFPVGSYFFEVAP